VFQRTETANLVVTLPKRAMPSAGYPLIVFVRTGGGGDRPLVDRGRQAVEGGPPVEPGEGPARYFARAGFAAIEVDGPLGGLRNPNGADEQYLTFNVGNLGAMRDNIRESAVELDVIAHVGAGLHVDASACAGSGGADVTFDASHIGIMGHSMGSWIEPLAVAHEPLFRALVMSGAGGSWIENIMYKQKPTPVYAAISTLVHVSDLKADDPIMTFAQWALEPADPQVYGYAIIREPVTTAQPRHVLMMQGIVDDYILPRIANSTSLSFGLDLAGPELDTENDPRLAGELPIGPLLSLIPLDARAAITLPATGNVGGTTAVVTQHLEDGIEDGHEVVFQTDVPKHEYQCFLASWIANGVPSVPVDGARDAPCP
jgi:dienelactone hydrolase